MVVSPIINVNAFTLEHANVNLCMLQESHKATKQKKKFPRGVAKLLSYQQGGKAGHTRTTSQRRRNLVGHVFLVKTVRNACKTNSSHEWFINEKKKRRSRTRPGGTPSFCHRSRRSGSSSLLWEARLLVQWRNEPFIIKTRECASIITPQCPWKTRRMHKFV